ncbi:MAG: HAD family hydrolase [Myxococcaceae bacterium]
MSPPPRALIFDLDNTLVDSEAAFTHALRAVGLEKSGEPYQTGRSTAKARLQKGNPSSRNRLLYFKALLESTERYSPAAVLDLTQRYEQALAQHVSEQWRTLKRDALFSRLKDRFDLIVLTNETTRAQMIKLAAIDPQARFFNKVITSEEHGAEKPARVMFDAALTAARLPATECTFVGDDVAADIVPALSLGMTAVLSSEFTPAKPHPGAIHVRRLAELETVLSC